MTFPGYQPPTSAKRAFALEAVRPVLGSLVSLSKKRGFDPDEVVILVLDIEEPEFHARAHQLVEAPMLERARAAKSIGLDGLCVAPIKRDRLVSVLRDLLPDLGSMLDLAPREIYKAVIAADKGVSIVMLVEAEVEEGLGLRWSRGGSA